MSSLVQGAASEQTFELAAELGRTLITYLRRRGVGIHAVADQHQTRLMQANGLDVLDGCGLGLLTRRSTCLPA